MGTILIVEDDVSIQEALYIFLQMEGYRVLTANHGKDALEVLKSETPCLILLDLTMPIMDGFEFLKAKNADHRIATIPVLITSAEADLAKSEKVIGILKKPIHLDTLLLFAKKCCP